MLKPLCSLFFLLLVLGCNSDSLSHESFASSSSYGAKEDSRSEMMLEEAEEGDQNNAYQPSEDIAERKIIKTADLRIQVDDVDISTSNISALVDKHGGFTQSLDLTNNTYQTNNSIVIRVPQAKFNTLLNELTKEAIHIGHKRIYSNDVTEEFVDIETRLKTKKEVRDRYVEILKAKAKTVDEVLNAEEKIRVIQEEIEAKEGRLKYLNNKVGLSTINLNIYQLQEGKVYKITYFQKMRRAFSNGIEVLAEFVLLIMNIWPFILIIAVIFYFIRRRLKFKKSKE